MGFFDSITDLTGGDLLGAGAQIVGGILGNNARSSANAQQMAFAQQQFQYQKDYARNRLQWAVEDAQKAGLHPMVAAGLSPASFSPVSVSSSPMETDWIGEAGQSLSYAASKAMDRKQQAEAFDFTKKLNQAQLDGVELDNELKVMNILAMLSTLNGSGPSSPTVNAKEPVGDSVSSDDNTFGDRVHNLYSLASFGDMVLTALNPDIADSLTESQVAHLSATLARDIEYYRNPKIKIDAFKKLTKGQQRAVVDGRAVFEYIPAVGGFMLTYPAKHGKHEVSGKLRLE